MLRYFLFLTICAITFQPSLCSDKRIANSPSEFPTRPTLLDYITCIELPFFCGTLMPCGMIFGSRTSVNAEALKDTLVITSGSSFVLAHTECIKALICSSQHRSELSSFYRTTPLNVRYEIAITLRTQSIHPEENAPYDYRATIFSTTQALHNKKPIELIHEATAFIETWIEQHQKENERTAVNLAPCVITKRGKSITLKPISLIWDKRIGIEQDLRACFFVSGTTHTQRTYGALFLSLLFLVSRIMHKNLPPPKSICLK